MTLLGKKDDPLIKIIDELRSEGLSDKEVVEDLRDQGYKNQDILDSIKKADLKAASRRNLGKVEPAFKEEEPEEEVDYPSPKEIELSSSDMEELVEKIIEEKWVSVKEELVELNKWKDNSMAAIEEIKAKVNEMMSAVERIKINVSDKIGSYSKGLEEVGTEIQAMDKVFKKVLPEFTTNIKQLSDIVDKLKKK